MVKVKKPEKKVLTIALAGNPNSGKTSIFNQLVGARQKVANWAGVTVERVEGQMSYNGQKLRIVDLPGTYSLTPYSQEEVIARNFLLEEHPDIVINVLDGTNLSRNLYLTTQLMEMRIPMVIAINMFDEVTAAGICVDVASLSKLFGVPVIPVSAKKNKGLKVLLDAVTQRKARTSLSYKLEYYAEIEQQAHCLFSILQKDRDLVERFPVDWLAVKALEKDTYVYKLLHDRPLWLELEPCLKRSIAYLEKHFEQDIVTTLVESRYSFINGALKESVVFAKRRQRTVTDIVDDVVLNRVLGLPIFFFLMWLMFQLTFTLGEAPMRWLEALFHVLSHTVSAVLPAGIFRSVLVDGVIAGVGGVLVFLPNILILFLLISLLETTGYMARAAFVVDKAMHAIGLHGRSFIPMILGFGCSVPAFMACRTLKNRGDRLTTMLIIPFISCGAKLPVYVLLIGAFFSKALAGNMLFGIYMFGVFVAVLMAKVLKSTMFKGLSEPFVMELPPYRMPSVYSILVHVWEKAVMYLHKAGTILLGFAILIWFLSNFPSNTAITQKYESQIRLVQLNQSFEERKRTYEVSMLERERAAEQLAYSYAGRAGKLIEPLIKPLGFNWQIGVALIAGFAAKEVVVSTLSVIYSLSSSSTAELQKALAGSPSFSPLIALSLMIFVLLYVPCMAATAVFHKEVGNTKWTVFYIFFTIGTAYICSFLVYQGGKLLGF